MFRLHQAVVLSLTYLACMPACFSYDYVQLGNACMRQGDYARAVAYFKGELQARPNNAAAHNDLGTAYLLMKRPGDAEAEFRRAAELDISGPIGLNARQALYQLNASPVVIPVSTPPKPAPPAPSFNSTHGITNVRGIDAKKNLRLEQTEREQRTTTDYQNQVANINREFDREIEKLKQEQSQRLQNEGGTISGAGTQPEVKGTKEALAAYRDYTARIEEFEQRRRAKLSEAKSLYQTNLKAVRQTKDIIEHTLNRRNPADNVQMVPTGADVYSRAYRTWGDPSGNPLPLLAEPKKMQSNGAKQRVKPKTQKQK